MLESILADLEKFLGLTSMKGSKEMADYYQLDINDTTLVWVKDLQPGIYFRSTIAPLPTTNMEDLYLYLSKGNFLGQGTGGSVISLDTNEKFLTLVLNIPYEVNYRIFRDKLEDFVNYLEFWKSEIEKMVTAQEMQD